MGYLEFILEPLNPGPKGTMEVEMKGPSKKPAPLIIFLFIVSIAVVGLLYYWVITLIWFHVGCTFFLMFMIIFYLVAGYFLRPHPRYDNLGWAGGMIDNPFRYSDDYNRWLFFLLIVLYPGRILSIWMVDFIFLIFRVFKRKERASDKWKKG